MEVDIAKEDLALLYHLLPLVIILQLLFPDLLLFPLDLFLNLKYLIIRSLFGQTGSLVAFPDDLVVILVVPIVFLASLLLLQTMPHLKIIVVYVP